MSFVIAAKGPDITRQFAAYYRDLLKAIPGAKKKTGVNAAILSIPPPYSAPVRGLCHARLPLGQAARSVPSGCFRPRR